MNSTQYFTISTIIAILLVPQAIAFYLTGPRSSRTKAFDGR